jgi:hypothetical protein
MGNVDKTLFTLNHVTDFLLVQIYVDDIIFGGSSHTCSEMAATAVLNGVRGKWQERSTTVGVKGAAATRTFAGEEAARQAVTCAKEMGVRVAAALEKNRRHNGLPG